MNNLYHNLVRFFGTKTNKTKTITVSGTGQSQILPVDLQEHPQDVSAHAVQDDAV